MPTIQQDATALLSQIPLGAIVGSPLKAAVDAQAAAALACYNFINTIGFDPVQETVKDAEGQSVTKTVSSKVRTITFVFERRKPGQPPAKDGAIVADGEATTLSVTVPLLTIMPLPFIRIESMTVNFKASISADDGRTQTTSSSDDKNLKGEAALGFAWWKVNVGGSISSKKDSTATNTSKYSVEHTMDISVHAVQDDMPAGLSKLLSFMTESIVVARG